MVTAEQLVSEHDKKPTSSINESKQSNTIMHAMFIAQLRQFVHRNDNDKDLLEM